VSCGANIKTTLTGIVTAPNGTLPLYNAIVYVPDAPLEPMNEGVTCDRCNGRLQQRDDDREETITTRLRVYESQTAPLVNYYRQRGNLREIDGVGKVEDIQKRIIDALGRPAN